MQDVQQAPVKSIRTNPANHAAEGDERRCNLHGTAFTYGCPGCEEFLDGEDLDIAQTVRERDEADTGERLTLEEFAAEVGIDVEEL